MSKTFFLQKANEILNIRESDNRKLVFVYTQPKVGSTSIVSSLRLYAIDKIHVIHVHDETMLKMLGNIEFVSIQDIINYNKIYLKKDVYVINVYRSPIERKISAFFEKIGTFHFNNTDANIDTNPNYTLNRIITRFNNVFTHIANGDHYLDLFLENISNNDSFCFDFENKYILQTGTNGVKYLTLRLKDASTSWNHILSTIFETHIKVIPDYESKNKKFANLYNRFKLEYQLPTNYLQYIQKNDKYFSFYYSPNEREEYIQMWTKNHNNNNNSNTIWVGYTEDQYKFYQQISTENAVLDVVRGDHYLDEGCLCNKCGHKRKHAIKMLETNMNARVRIKHEMPENNSKSRIPLNNIVKRMPKKVMKLL
uniref:Uncharacterized protein n=1 Tax=viral metagenome TaxID=1070528 RepID=A0A6C0IRU5_9ZZZZ